MALIIHSSSSCLLPKKPHLLLLHLHHSPAKSTPPFIVKSQDSSSSSSAEPPKPTTTQPIDGSSSVLDPPPKKPTSTGLGFGSSSLSSAKSKVNPVSTKKKQRGGRERASIIRRSPVEKPEFVSQQEDGAQAKDQLKSESAFLLAWLVLGLVILIQGIALAASGFLPEEWDKLFVKYLYPSFTPTVFLFVAGTVAYGVVKYLQNEKLQIKK